MSDPSSLNFSTPSDLTSSTPEIEVESSEGRELVQSSSETETSRLESASDGFNPLDEQIPKNSQESVDVPNKLISGDTLPEQSLPPGGAAYDSEIDHLVPGEGKVALEKLSDPTPLDTMTSKASDEDLLYDSSDLRGPTPAPAKIATSLKNYSNLFSLNIIAIVLLIGLSFVIYSFLTYFQEGSKAFITDEKKQKIVQETSRLYNDYGQKIGLFNLHNYDGNQLHTAGELVAQGLLDDKSLNFVQKKDLLQRDAITLGSEIIQLYQNAKNLRESMNKDGFFPEELILILKEDGGIEYLQRSLSSLEIIKFSSAMKVFSLTDIFVSSLSNSLGITKTEAKQKIDNLISRGEKDVEVYLNMCYNNPYESLNCTTINDFESYYKNFNVHDEEKNFDTSFFKQLMSSIDVELEYSEVPNFSIIFNSFDARNSNIGFTVEVNTFKEDEIALRQQGIKNPHIFTVSELIKSLKLSTFVLGKKIDARDIKVTTKPVVIGTSRYIVNNSTKTFMLPIQKNVEREIFDFYTSYEGFELGETSDTLTEDELLFAVEEDTEEETNMLFDLEDITYQDFDGEEMIDPEESALFDSEEMDNKITGDNLELDHNENTKNSTNTGVNTTTGTVTATGSSAVTGTAISTGVNNAL